MTTPWLAHHPRALLARLAELNLLERAYTLAALTFVALLPLLLVLAGLLTSDGEESVVAEDLIARLGLVGAGAEAARDMIIVRHEGLYLTGTAVILYTAFTLSRRTGRAYNAIWRTPELPPRQQWRGLVWLLIQVVMTLALTELRALIPEVSTSVGVLILIAALLAWFAAEYGSQLLFTRGAVARSRLLVATSLVTAGRIGIGVWTHVYLADALSRQAQSFGPIGVVFGIFTAFFVTWLVILGSTTLGAELTRPHQEGGPIAHATPMSAAAPEG